ncbi:MAG: NAD(P)-dependent oxidoreductase [Chloroflexi bacterium]|nr:MAG: NAD(P)-dependent oxidoreductase [Chloroflexota bacterium]
MKVLVTGASGFIGSRLVQGLLAHGMSVRGTYRRSRPDIPGVSWYPVAERGRARLRRRGRAQTGVPELDRGLRAQ